MGIASLRFLASSTCSSSRIWGFQCITCVQTQKLQVAAPKSKLNKIAIKIPSTIVASLKLLWIECMLGEYSIHYRDLLLRASSVQLHIQSSAARRSSVYFGNRFLVIWALNQLPICDLLVLVRPLVHEIYNQIRTCHCRHKHDPPDIT